MAVTINQEPTSPNGSQADILYVVSSTNTLEPQFKFVCDVRGNAGTILSRIKQPMNPSGYGVFEISQILDDYIGYDEIWKISGISASIDNTKQFSILFGEEWGATAYGTTQIYNGLGDVVGDPEKTGSVSPLVIIPAVEERDIAFNWQSGSYVDTFLTNSPSTIYAKPDEYATLSHINISGSDFRPLSFTYTVYNSAGSVIAAKAVLNPLSGSSESNNLINIPIGPQNFVNDATLSILTGSAWAYYDVTAYNKDTKRVYRLDDCDAQNGTRFAFINRLGVWDYYTATLTKTENRQFNQNTYQKNFINYSTDGLIQFNPSRRGESVYNKQIDATYTAQTDWLEQDRADWLVELFESPSVYIQQGSEFIPVIITNQSIDMKTNPRGQKLFTYQIQYRLANKKKNRR
jgi:hypothetical protein